MLSEDSLSPDTLFDLCADTVLDSLSANIAILDENGVILRTNRSWQMYARENGMSSGFDCVGLNYIEISEAATGVFREKSLMIAAGIRAVIAGQLPEFVIDYPCHSPEQKRWFNVRVTRFSQPRPVRLVVSNEEVTPLKLAQEALREREAELEVRRQNLEEANTALKLLLRQREEDKRELEGTVLLNAKEIVIPFLEKLGNTALSSQQKAYLSTIESHIQELTSPFLQNAYGKVHDLTPREIEVAILVKDGRSTKEIAEMLNISVNAVDFHRKNVRRKFGLTSKRANLRSHLLAMAV